MKLVNEQPPTVDELVGYLHHNGDCPRDRGTEATEYRAGVIVVACLDCGARFPDHGLPAGPQTTWDPVVQHHRAVEQRRHEEEQQQAQKRTPQGGEKR